MGKDFYQLLEDLVITQASRLINLNLYSKAVLATLPLALFATNRSGQIQIINSAAEKIFGIRGEDVKGKSLVEIADFSQEFLDRARQTFGEGSCYNRDSVKLRSVSGKEIVGNFRLQPLRDEEDLIQGVLLTVEDLSYVHFLQDAFKHYVPPAIASRISQNPKELKLGGEEKELSVLFSDLIGFSTLSEHYPPGEMVELLSDYFDEMTAQVFKFEGTLCEYVGDELLAIFGAPVNQPDNAVRACFAALAMRERLKQLRTSWSESKRPQLQARIGINSGSMLVGNLGSRHRFSYGVVGDNVNLGSRLENLCGVYGVSILLAESTAVQVYSDMILREVDLVRVKGRSKAVRIFELVAEKNSSLSSGRLQSLELYDQGLLLYRDRNWEQAIKILTMAIDKYPDEKPSRVMIERCELYREHPPDEEWCGVFTF